MNGYSMPTYGSSGCSLEDHFDWAHRIVRTTFGSTNMDPKLQARLERNMANALRAERKASADLLAQMADAQLHEGTAKILRAAADAIRERLTT